MPMQSGAAQRPKNAANKRPKPVGRYGYHNTKGAHHLPIAPNANARAKVSVGAVDAPYAAGTRDVAFINREIDVLENEYANRRISVAAYHEGRFLQRLFERTTSIKGGSVWNGGRIDAATESPVWRALETAEEVEAERKQCQRLIGEVPFALLEKILRDGWSFADCATGMKGGLFKPGERQIAKVADRFRWLLDELSKARASAYTNESGGIRTWREGED